MKPNSELKVKLYNHEKKKVERFEQLKNDQVSNSAEIILEFTSDRPLSEANKKSDVEFNLVNSKPKNDAEREAAENEAVNDYIKENSSIAKTGVIGTDIS
jgi:hypothetical protein